MGHIQTNRHPAHYDRHDSLFYAPQTWTDAAKYYARIEKVLSIHPTRYVQC